MSIFYGHLKFVAGSFAFRPSAFSLIREQRPRTRIVVAINNAPLCHHTAINNGWTYSANQLLLLLLHNTTFPSFLNHRSVINRRLQIKYQSPGKKDDAVNRKVSHSGIIARYRVPWTGLRVNSYLPAMKMANLYFKKDHKLWFLLFEAIFSVILYMSQHESPLQLPCISKSRK